MTIPSAPVTRRIVFIDIDGTLTDVRGDIPASAVDAIRAARRNGHLVLVATGRSPLEIDPRVDAVGFDGMITGAGSYLEFAGEYLVDEELSETQVRRMVAVFDELGLDYSLQGRRGMYPSPGHRRRLRRALAGLGYTDEQMENSGVRFHVLDPGELRYDHAAKAVFDGDDPDAYAKVAARLGDEFTVVGGTLPGMGDASGEVSPRGIHKAHAMQVLLDRLGLTMADAIAIGDSGNDIEMLRAAGVGICMGDGTDAAKAAADEVTGAVHDDGLHDAFRRHGLI